MNGGYSPPPGYGYPYPPQFSAGPPGPNPWNRPLRRCANTVCFGLVASLVLSYMVMPVLYTLARYALNAAGVVNPALFSLFDHSANLVAYLLVFLPPLFIMKSWIGIPARIAFPLRSPRAGIAVPAVFVCLGSSVVGSVSAAMLVTLLEQIFGVKASMSEPADPVGVPAAIVYFLSIVVFPSIIEELLFRGVIMQSLRRFGDGFALAVSAILFSFAHGNLLQGPNALVMGIVIGYFVLRTGSLLTGMLIHFVNNALAVFFGWLASMMPGHQAIISSAMLAGYALAGAAALAALMINNRNMFRLAPSDYPVEPSKKIPLFFSSPVAILYTLCTLAVVAMTLRQ